LHACSTIRLKLLKIGALVRISVRRIKVAMASSCTVAGTCGTAAVRLNAAARRGALPCLTRDAASAKAAPTPRPTGTPIRLVAASPNHSEKPAHRN